MIVITAPTGHVGSKLVNTLLAGGEAVRVIVRDPAKLPTEVRDQAEVVAGSHGEAAVVQRAFEGADAVFWLVPPDPQAKSARAAYVDFSRPAADVLRAGGVGHVVAVSSLGRGRPQERHAGLVTASLAMDDLIAGSGVHFRALTMPSFMDNMLRQVASLKSQGTFSDVLPAELKTQTVATVDIAAAATRLLTDRSWTGVGEVPVLGPEELSSNDLAQIMSEVLGKPVRYEQMPVQALKDGLLARGRTEEMAQATVDMMVAVSDGIYSNEPRVSVVSPPTSFRQWCQDVLKPAVQG